MKKRTKYFITTNIVTFHPLHFTFTEWLKILREQKTLIHRPNRESKSIIDKLFNDAKNRVV